jgi:hypothetical protein
MFAVSSGQFDAAAGGFIAAPPRRSLASIIGHGVIIGVAATVLQAMVLLAILYACGILAS